MAKGWIDPKCNCCDFKIYSSCFREIDLALAGVYKSPLSCSQCCLLHCYLSFKDYVTLCYIQHSHINCLLGKMFAQAGVCLQSVKWSLTQIICRLIHTYLKSKCIGWSPVKLQFTVCTRYISQKYFLLLCSVLKKWYAHHCVQMLMACRCGHPSFICSYHSAGNSSPVQIGKPVEVYCTCFWIIFKTKQPFLLFVFQERSEENLRFKYVSQFLFPCFLNLYDVIGSYVHILSQVQGV